MDEMRKKLAKNQHEIWSHWMKYMFSQGQMQEDGSWRMPAEKVERWQRQLRAGFEELEALGETTSDYEMADWVLRTLQDD